MANDHTHPNAETRAAEAAEARAAHEPDRAPTPEEEDLASRHDLDPSVPAHERDMAERGVKQKGEGRIPG